MTGRRRKVGSHNNDITFSQLLEARKFAEVRCCKAGAGETARTLLGRSKVFGRQRRAMK
jgi:hypothetical protein